MNQPNQPAQVQEKAPKPQGLLPKNVQSWLLIGLAFLMVAIMWLTGGKKPQTPAKAASSAAPGPGATRSQRNQDCRDAEPHSGIAAPATCRADRSRAADPLARCRQRKTPQQSQQPSACGHGARAAAGRPDPGRAEEACLRVAVCFECRSELPQTSADSRRATA